jgi:MoaA/NifB/PqqE/SkfB family radical SAM enzyme
MPGGFVKVCQAIKNLLAEKIRIRLNIVINSKNYGHLLNLTKMIHKQFLGIESIDYSFIVSQGKAYDNHFLVPKLTKIVPHLILAYKYCQKNNIAFNNPACGVPVCFVPDYKEFSVEYRNLKYAEKNNDLVKNSSNKIKLNACKKCPDKKYCLGIWRGYIDIHGDNEFK